MERVKRDTVRIKCLTQEHNIMLEPGQGLETRPLDLEVSTLTTKPCPYHFISGWDG